MPSKYYHKPLMHINSVAAAVESVMHRISSIRFDCSTALLLFVQLVMDTWCGIPEPKSRSLHPTPPFRALERRMCQCCSQLYSSTDGAQVMAAADQLDEQLHACALAFKLRLQEESRWHDVTFFVSFRCVYVVILALFCGRNVYQLILS